MNWKRVIARTSIIACLSIPFTGCGDDVDTTPRPSVANLERLKKGMAPAEVKRIHDAVVTATMAMMHMPNSIVGFNSGKLENAAYTDK